MVLNVTQMEFKPAREKAKGGLFLSPADSLPANSQSVHPPAESRARALLKSRTPNAYVRPHNKGHSAAHARRSTLGPRAPLIRNAKPFVGRSPYQLPVTLTKISGTFMLMKIGRAKSAEF